MCTSSFIQRNIPDILKSSIKELELKFNILKDGKVEVSIFLLTFYPKYTSLYESQSVVPYY